MWQTIKRKAVRCVLWLEFVMIGLIVGVNMYNYALQQAENVVIIMHEND